MFKSFLSDVTFNEQEYVTQTQCLDNSGMVDKHTDKLLKKTDVAVQL